MEDLLSPSESQEFTTFLSAVDIEAGIDWDGHVKPALANQIPVPEGSEALAKATKDLMALDPAEGVQHRLSQQLAPPPGMNTSFWPSFASDGSPPLPHHYTSNGLYNPRTYAQPFPPDATPRPTAASFFASQPNIHIAPLHDPHQPPSDSPRSGYTLPPIMTADGAPRPSPMSSAVSAPSVLLAAGPSSSGQGSMSKRALPQPAVGPSSAKRARSSFSESRSSFSEAQPHPAEAGSSSAVAPRRSRRTASSSQPSKGVSFESSPEANGAAARGSKPALLSPSQKRANHIQSEQKRRANIRRGYEALCEVVPALREAARAEAEAAEDEEPGGGSRKRRGKDAGDGGRAGPRSESVVLAKTIDYINALLADRHALLLRLQGARNAVPQGHPALALDPHHLDERGVPLWDREWSGGTGSKDDDADGGSDDDG